MFVANNVIHMHDVDMVGILYFPRQFRFVHDAFEDFLNHEGLGFDKVFLNTDFYFVIVHCESDYLAPLKLGDRIKIELRVEHIGTTSFTIFYTIYKEDGQKVGTAKTVHVTIDQKKRKKIPIPQPLRTILERHL